MAWLAVLNLGEPWFGHLTASAQPLLTVFSSVSFTFGRYSQGNHLQYHFNHLQSRGTPWRQCASHVKVRGTSSKMDVKALTVFSSPTFPVMGDLERMQCQYVYYHRYLLYGSLSCRLPHYPMSSLDYLGNAILLPRLPYKI